MRSIRPRYAVSLFVAFAVMAAGAAFVAATPNSEATDVVDRFAHALDQRDVAAAAALTSYPNAAAQTISTLLEDMGPGTSSTALSQFIPLDDTSGFFTLDTTWNFGDARPDDPRSWQFTSRGTVRKLSPGWRVSWDPSVVSPDLGGGQTVRYGRTDAAAPVVFDATSAPMMTESNIASVRLDPASMPDPVASTEQLADIIDVVAPLITSETLLKQLADAHGSAVTAVRLRADDYAVLEDDLRAVPGVVLYAEPTLLAADRRLDSPLLDAARSVWQSSRDSTAGWAVTVTRPDGTTERKAGFQGPPPPDITSTLDPTVQLAAQEAAVSAATPASVVVLRPSTGDLVAVAQNSYANQLGTPALTTAYPVSDLPEVVTRAPGQFGLGTDWNLPGTSLVTAVLPNSRAVAVDRFRAQPVTSHKSDADSVAVTPFGLAQLGAVAVRGSAPAPAIVRGQPATSDNAPEPVDAEALSALRDRFADGALTGGTGDDRWIVTTRGDLSVAVYVEDADDDGQVERLTNRFFAAGAEPAE